MLTGSLPLAALANPQGGTVVDGSANIVASGNRVDVYQGSDRAIIDWRSFSIAPGETTQFHQPSSGSIALNRVTGADPSRIFGTLRANGRVFLINRNGILFGAGSRIDVSGLVATTSDIRNRDFMAGRMEFTDPSANPSAGVVNEGEISIADMGYAALVAPQVRNAGVINARLGRVTLGAAEAFALDLYGDDLVAFRVGVSRTPVAADGNPPDALVSNSGRISADGGIVQLAAQNVEAVVRSVINTDGVIHANALERRDGKIVLRATGPGDVEASGTLSAAGGSVSVTGDGNVALYGAGIAAAEVTIAGDADKSGAGDLNAGPTGGDVTVTDSRIDVDDEYGKGGRVEITADRVAVLGNTVIDASGSVGGGEILIGGEFQGNGGTRNADATIVGGDVSIRADAEQSGEGGRIILWADGYTRFHGTISATGGVDGGDGGFVEVSGKENLDFRGVVDLTAVLGRAGTLLLDPVDIVVQTIAVDGANGGTIAFADSPVLEPWEVSPAALDGVGGNIVLQATNNITISNAVNLTTAGASFTATARNNIAINDSITTNGGTITLTADSDASGAGDLTVAATKSVTTGNAALSVTADDLVLNGSLNSGAAATTLLVSDGGTIGLGATAGNMTISGTELQNITATGLTIGDATNGSITVNGITAANSNNVTGTVTLNATKAASAVAFSTAASTFNALTVNADNGIAVNVGLTTDTGNLVLEGDADNAADGTDSIAFSAGLTITSAGSITLDATTGGITGAGALTLNAVGGITLNNGFTGSGSLVANADKDANSSGNFVATTLNVGANSLNVTGVSVNAGTSVTAGATTLNGAVSGSGLTVSSLTLTGVSAALNSTSVGGATGSAAAAATAMTDASTHLVNGCQKGGCTSSTPTNIDVVQVDTDAGNTGNTGSTGGNSGTGNTGTGGDTSVTGETEPTSSPSNTSTDSTAGDFVAGNTGDGSYNPASGDLLLDSSATSFTGFFLLLKEESAETLDLLVASENLDNPEVASLVEALSEILGEYELVSTSIPTNAFNDKAEVLIPGLLRFEPAAGGSGGNQQALGNYRPPSFGRFQF